jgi:hypothetical protein
MSRDDLDGRARQRALALLLAVLLPAGAGACGDDGAARPVERPRAGPEATATAGPARRAPEPAGRPAPPPAAWTRGQVLRRVSDRTVRVEGERVRIDRGTVTCGGLGAPADERGGEPAWTRFRCVQPTFPSGAVAGPDAVFVVTATGRRTFAVSDQRFTTYRPEG